MNGTRILVDTNILIYLLNGDFKIADLLNGNQIYISFITELELYGQKPLEEKDQTTIASILSFCTIIDINNGIKSSAIAIRQHQKLNYQIV